MLLDDLGLHLERKGQGVLATNLFLGALPDTAPDVCTVLFEYAGSPALRASGGIAAEIVRVQVYCRGTSYTDTRERAEKIYRLLDGLGDIDINDTHYLWIQALSPPFLLGRDESNRIEIVCNYEILKRQTDVEV